MKFSAVLGLVIIFGFVLPAIAGASSDLAQVSETPGIRMSHTMAYDPHNEVMVMFGGSTSDGGYHELGDT